MLGFQMAYRLMHENGFMPPSTIYVHAATLTRDSYHRIAATGGAASVSTESEQSAGPGYPPTWQLREHGIPVSLSMDSSVWWSGATRGGARALGLDSVVGSLEPGKKADPVLIENDASPVMFPLLNPYGHVTFQAQRGDVHTVLDAWAEGRPGAHGRLLTSARQRTRRAALRIPPA